MALWRDDDCSREYMQNRGADNKPSLSITQIGRIQHQESDSSNSIAVFTEYCRNGKSSISVMAMESPPLSGTHAKFLEQAFHSSIARDPQIHELHFGRMNLKDKRTKTMLHSMVAHVVDVNATILSVEFKMCVCNVEIGSVLGVMAKESKLSLSFEGCRLENEAGSKVAQLLRTNRLSSLALEDCEFDREALDLLTINLAKNLSLVRFAFVAKRRNLLRAHPDEKILKGVVRMLGTNHKSMSKMVIGSTPNSCASMLEGIRLALTQKGTASSLQMLEILDSKVNHRVMEKITSLLRDVGNMKALSLGTSKVSPEALEVLSGVICHHSVLERLELGEQCLDAEHYSGGLRANEVLSWRIRELILPDLSGHNALEICKQLASNPYLQSIDMHNVERSVRQKLLTQAFIPNKYMEAMDRFYRVSAINIGVVQDEELDGICMALLTNNTIKEVALILSTACNLIKFAQVLEYMRGLRKVVLGSHSFHQFTEEVFEVLLKTLVANWNIQTLHLDLGGTACFGDTVFLKFNEMAEPLLSEVHQQLIINRVGGTTLAESLHTPLGLWPYVMSRRGVEPGGIFFLLTNTPQLVFIGGQTCSDAVATTVPSTCCNKKGSHHRADPDTRSCTPVKRQKTL